MAIRDDFTLKLVAVVQKDENGRRKVVAEIKQMDAITHLKFIKLPQDIDQKLQTALSTIISSMHSIVSRFQVSCQDNELNF